MPVVLNGNDANAAAAGGQTLSGAGTLDPGSSNQVWVEVAEIWGDEWAVMPELRPLTASVPTLSTGFQRATFEYDYGPQVKIEDAAAFETRATVDINGWWVRIRIAIDRAERTLWIGRLEGPVREVAGDQRTADTPTPAGKQRWAAYGPDRLLQKVNISQTTWQFTDGSKYQLERLDGFNVRGVDGKLAGNRSTNQAVGGVGGYTFGGTAVWDGLSILDYLLRNHLDQGATAPFWGVDGLIDFLNTERQPRIDPREMINVLAVVKAVCDPRYGLDAVIRYDEEARGIEGEPSFLIDVFSLLPEALPFGGLPDVTLPVNAARVPFTVSDARDGGCTIEFAEQQLADTLRLRGDFIKTVFTVGDSAVTGDAARALAKGWTAAEETAYRAGDTITPSATAVQHDIARADERYVPVFQRFVVDQSLGLFDYDDGYANPVFLADGTIGPLGGGTDSATHFQRWDVGTLRELPLQKGVDYSTNPPVNRYPAGVEVDFLAPLVLVYVPGVARYVAVDRLSEFGLPGSSVEALENAIGVQLASSPRHLYARADWAGAAASLFPADQLGVDWRKLVATIAMRTDQRLAVEIAVPAGLAAGDSSVRVFDEPLAQAWWLSRNTVIGVTAAGAVRKSPSAGFFVRNDINLLKSLAAGAIGRYLIERVRAVVRRIGRIEPWHDHLGAVGDLAGEQGTLNAATPFTTVTWDFAAQTTTLYAGQANKG